MLVAIQKTENPFKDFISITFYLQYLQPVTLTRALSNDVTEYRHLQYFIVAAAIPLI